MNGEGGGGVEGIPQGGVQQALRHLVPCLVIRYLSDDVLESVSGQSHCQCCIQVSQKRDDNHFQLSMLEERASEDTDFIF